jgi:hypothetical protein
MIWNGIITLVVSVLLAFIDMFPTVDSVVLAEFNNGLTPFKNYLASAGWIFPVSQFFLIVGIVLTIEGILFTIKIAHWLLKNVSAGFVK